MRRCGIGIITLLILSLGAALFLKTEQGKRQSFPQEDKSTLRVEERAATQENYGSFDREVELTVEGHGTILLEDYLVGVLLAEVPGDFPLEALKAQAIASRTFVLAKGETQKHEGAHVCGNSACCQGWKDPDTCDPRERAQMQEAVQATDGLVLTYGGALIDATFFSCSGGRTETALAVWGGDVPYLQSVPSPGEEAAPPYCQKSLISWETLRQTVETAYPQANLSGEWGSWLGAVDRTAGGGVGAVFIGGIPIPGTAFRSLFSLPSTNISFSPTPEGLALTTYGYGHRVGMSQYGAKAMGEQGCDFRQILLHYYQGVEICRFCLPSEHIQTPVFPKGEPDFFCKNFSFSQKSS